MKLIGLTGSIATGKSTVASMFRKFGFYVIDADELVHEMYKKGNEGYNRLLDVFGRDILDESGEIDRKRLGQIVLRDKNKLRLLESIVHPLVEKERQKILKRIEKENPEAVVIYDVPLLFEKNLTHMFDCVIVVYVPRDVQIKRLMERDGISFTEAQNRISLQMDIEEKAKLADIVVDNSKTLEETERQVDMIAGLIKEGKLC